MNKPYGNEGVGGSGEEEQSLINLLEKRWVGVLVNPGRGAPARLLWREASAPARFSWGNEDAWGASLVPWQLRLFGLDFRARLGAGFGNLGLQVGAPTGAAAFSPNSSSEELQETLGEAKGVWLLRKRPMAAQGLRIRPGRQRRAGVALKCEEFTRPAKT